MEGFTLFGSGAHLGHPHMSPFAAAAAAAGAQMPQSPFDQNRIDKLDPMQNQPCRVCDEPAAGFHFGAFTCEGCKSFFGRTCNNQAVIQECKNNYRCVINKKNRTACKACRLRKCLMVGMSKSGSRYGRRSNWFKIHCLMQQVNPTNTSMGPTPPTTTISGHLAEPPPVSPPGSSSSLIHPLNSPTSPLGSSPPGLWRPLESSSPTRRSPISASTVSSSFRSEPNLPRSHVPRSPRSPSHSPLNTTGGSISSMDSGKDCSSAAAFTAAFLKQQLKPPMLHSPLEQPQPEKTCTEQELLTAHSLASLNSRFNYPAVSAAASMAPCAAAVNPFSFLPPTFNFPMLAGLPIHKQALLSPLLASSHMLAAAAAARKAYPALFGGAFEPEASPVMAPPVEEASPAIDALAEHKALLERFKIQLAEAAAANRKSAMAPSATEGLNDDASSIDSLGSEKFPHLSDTEDEAEVAATTTTTTLKRQRKESQSEDDTAAVAGKKKRKDEAPLDLTCA